MVAEKHDQSVRVYTLCVPVAKMEILVHWIRSTLPV